MKIQLIRNATLKIDYAEKVILVDPMLSKKGTIESFAGIEKNPTVDLPLAIDKILEKVDFVLLTHTHQDHFDDFAKKYLPKDMKIFCQPCDKEKIESFGFSNVASIENSLTIEKITMFRTDGKHGSGEVLNHMGEVSGFVLQSKSEPTVYIVGDSIWVKEVEESLHRYNPKIIITNSGGAYIPNFEKTPILMDEQETIRVATEMPNATIIAVHMESLDHCTVTRDLLRDTAVKENIASDRLLIPKDGELIDFSK